MEDSGDYGSDFFEESVASEVHSIASHSNSVAIPDELSIKSSNTRGSRAERWSQASPDEQEYSNDFDEEASHRSVKFATPLSKPSPSITKPTPGSVSKRRNSIPFIETKLGVVKEAAGEENSPEQLDDYSMDFEASRSAFFETSVARTPTRPSSKTASPMAGKPPRPQSKRSSLLDSMNKDYSEDFERSSGAYSMNFEHSMSRSRPNSARQRARVLSASLGGEDEYSMDFERSMASPQGANASQSEQSFPSYGAEDFEEDAEDPPKAIPELPPPPPPKFEDFMPSFVPVHVWELRKKLLTTLDKAVQREATQDGVSELPKQKGNKDDLIKSRHELEQGLEAIETELLLVRRKQREDAQTRKTKAREKRRRAEERRSKHISDLSEAKQRAEKAESAANDLQRNVEELKAQVDRMEAIIESSKAAREKGEELLQVREQELAESREQVKNTQEQNTTLEARIQSLETEYNETKANYREESELRKKKYELEIGILRGSMEAAERRIDADRVKLPQYHQTILRQEEDRLHRMEESLEIEKAALRREKEVLRQETERSREAITEEARELRSRAMEQVADAKAALTQQRKDWERECASKWAENDAKLLKIEAESIAVERGKSEIESGRQKLVEDRAALSARAALLAPQLRDLEEAQNLLDKKKLEVEESASRAEQLSEHVHGQLADLKKKDDELAKKLEELVKREEHLFDWQNELNLGRSEINENVKEVQAQRLQLFQQQMELSFQVQQVQRAITLIKNMEGTSGRLKMALELSSLAWDKTLATMAPLPNPRIEELQQQNQEMQARHATPDVLSEMPEHENQHTTFNKENQKYFFNGKQPAIQPQIIELASTQRAYHYNSQGVSSSPENYGHFINTQPNHHQGLQQLQVNRQHHSPEPRQLGFSIENGNIDYAYTAHSSYLDETSSQKGGIDTSRSVGVPPSSSSNGSLLASLSNTKRILGELSQSHQNSVHDSTQAPSKSKNDNTAPVNLGEWALKLKAAAITSGAF